ncbi:MAG: hypothetical protein ACERKD_12825 [Prolixibacteraceae bacterium]
MNKLVFVILAVMLSTSCKKVIDAVDEFTKFNMPYETTVTIPGIANSFISDGTNIPKTPISLDIPGFATNSSEYFANNKTSSELVENITLTDATLTLILPEGKDFSFLSSLEIYLSAEGLDEIMIAWNDSISNDIGNELTLETTENNLKAYIMKDTIAFKIDAVVQKFIGIDYEVKLNTNFLIDAKILGI